MLHDHPVFQKEMGRVGTFLFYHCVEYELGQLTTSSPDITTDNGNKLLGTTFIIDDETRDQDERNDYIEE